MCSPVTASMRRRFEPIEPSDTTLMGPISPVARTCVPPHSSRLRPGLEDPDDVAVLVAEEGDGAHGLGLGHRHLYDADGVVDEDLVVGQVLDARDLLGGDGCVVAEVEPQAVGVDQRARPA